MKAIFSFDFPFIIPPGHILALSLRFWLLEMFYNFSFFLANGLQIFIFFMEWFYSIFPWTSFQSNFQIKQLVSNSNRINLYSGVVLVIIIYQYKNCWYWDPEKLDAFSCACIFNVCFCLAKESCRCRKGFSHSQERFKSFNVFLQERFEDCSHALVLSSLPPLTHLPYPAPLANQLCLALRKVVIANSFYLKEKTYFKDSLMICLGARTMQTPPYALPYT